MTLSIIIPVYNVEKYISTCLDSLLDQGLDSKEYEIIIVNDGSTDDSIKIAQGYAKINDHIKVFNKENGGVGSARNFGMKWANGKYIYFIDPDDYIISNSLKKLVDICDLHKLDILTFLSTSFSSSSSKGAFISKKINPEESSGEEIISAIVTGEDYVANLNYRGEAWWYLVNREFLKNSGISFIEGRWLEDAVFTIELILSAKRMAHLKLNAHRYRVTAGTAMKTMEPSHYLKMIRDMQYAVLGLDPILKRLKNKGANPDCIIRIKNKQQSLVFFSMLRIFKSTMSFDEVKLRMNEMISVNAYPLDSFLGKDFNGVTKQILVRLLKTKSRFYFFFRLFNPILKLRYKFSNPV